MKIIENVRRFFGAAPKPIEKQVTLPNGRTAIVDERGNFLRFKPGPP